MLVLTRHEKESIAIPAEQLIITVAKITGKRVSLAFDAPKDLQILRSELQHHLQTNSLAEFPTPKTHNELLFWRYLDNGEWSGLLNDMPLWHIRVTNLGTFNITDSILSRLSCSSKVTFGSLHSAKANCELIERLIAQQRHSKDHSITGGNVQ
jgi:carbon storage regulator CsrA